MQLHWFPHMHSTELTDYHATAYPDNRKSCNWISNCATAYPIFRLEKAMQNDIITTAYRGIVTTSYPLLHLAMHPSNSQARFIYIYSKPEWSVTFFERVVVDSTLTFNPFEAIVIIILVRDSSPATIYQSTFHSEISIKYRHGCITMHYIYNKVLTASTTTESQ